MKLAIISFTAAGKDLSIRLSNALAQDSCILFTTTKLADETVTSYGNDLNIWTGNAFSNYDGIVFYSACGIAVRALHLI